MNLELETNAAEQAAETREARLSSLQGTIQRVNYQRKEMTVIANGKVWRFQIVPGCRLWFNDTPAILRCFHALDAVTVYFDSAGQAHALYSWEATAA